MSYGVTEVSVRFGGKPALDGVSLDLAAGEVTVVVGGDGAGKTTLLRLLAGALAPDSGDVRRPGARRIGYLAARSGTYPDLTVDENLAFTASAYGLAPGEASSRAALYLQRTGLAAVRNRLAGDLSGGMRQKLGTIGALLHGPELVVLDEPTTGVDPVSRGDLWWLIARSAAAGATVMVATSYLDEAERAAQVLVLEEGLVLAQGTPREITEAIPGRVYVAAERPAGEAAARAWRRRTTWRVWSPDGSPPAGCESDCEKPDLSDAVTAAELARERERAGGEADAA